LKKIWKFFCNVKLTVVLFVLILIPSVIGTIIQQNADNPAVYLEVYGPLWNDVFEFLGFYDIYHDLRFIVLLVMLGLNTFACTVNRFRPKWNMIGMLMTHVGLLMILLGAVVGATQGVKGFMAISEGETLEEIRKQGAMNEFLPIPFKVHLVDFILDMHKEPMHKLYVIDVKAEEQKGRHIEVGKAIALVEPRWAGVMSLLGIKPKAATSIEPKRFLTNAVQSTSLSEGPEQTGVEAVEIRLRGGGMEHHGFTVSGSPAAYNPRGTHIGIFYSTLESIAAIESKVEETVASTRSTNRIDVVLPGAALTSTHSGQVGSKFEVEGHTVEVLRYVPDFMMGENNQVTTRSEFPHNPAIQVKITKPEGSSVGQWLFVKFPDMHTPEGLPFKLKYTRLGPGGHVVDHVFIYNAPDSLPVVAHARDGRLLKRAEIEPSELFAVDGTGREMLIETFYENMNRNTELVELGEGRGHPAVEIGIGPAGERETMILWKDTPVDIPGYRLVYVQEERVADFYSVLQILEGDEVVAEKKIEVNDPIRYGGYAFYQQSYDSKGLSWSGLQVRKDPGVPLVYGGFLVQIIGMIVIFYINPVIRKATKAKA
jgi:hypothetical protein